jgi:hypothetical protein
MAKKKPNPEQLIVEDEPIVAEPELKLELDNTQLAQIRDVPEPGSEPPPRMPEAEVVIAGFATYHAARGFLSQMRNGDKYRIVRVDEMESPYHFEGRILAYYLEERPDV